MLFFKYWAALELTLSDVSYNVKQTRREKTTKSLKVFRKTRHKSSWYKNEQFWESRLFALQRIDKLSKYISHI